MQKNVPEQKETVKEQERQMDPPKAAHVSKKDTH
jgi:hypothetical protein